MLQLNKRKRLLWCKEQLKYNEEFTGVIFTDECSVQLEQEFTVKSRVFYKTLLGAIASVKVKLPKGCSITPQGVFHCTHRYS